MHQSDSTTQNAFQEIAELLATAFLRYSKVVRLPANYSPQPVNKSLAIPGVQSVHEQ